MEPKAIRADAAAIGRAAARPRALSTRATTGAPAAAEVASTSAAVSALASMSPASPRPLTASRSSRCSGLTTALTRTRTGQGAAPALARVPQRLPGAGPRGGGHGVFEVENDGVGAGRESLGPALGPVGRNEQEQRQRRQIGRHGRLTLRGGYCRESAHPSSGPWGRFRGDDDAGGFAQTTHPRGYDGPATMRSSRSLAISPSA